ncbi:trypsin-like serine protease [Thalassomonas sp. RHCl1]|uniref:trypsin-like serine protease n=1 Tax=Thalassomonas sp. RHCl1 TaxID=2995320 RepID=UPI00248B48AB|nr:trypsin-like serine protease [Thalassomonas sp. RHCl1]
MLIEAKKTLNGNKLSWVLKSAILASGFVSAAGYCLSEIEKPARDVGIQIVGGSVTAPYSKPYQVALLLNGQQGCGGTLISSEWVLTAAHCLGQVSTNTLTVKVGAHSLRANDGDTHRVSQIITHENWRSGGYQTGYDIGLLRLATPADNRYTPAKLPTAAIESQYAGVGSYVTVSGWGLTSNNGSPSDVLREVPLPVLSNASCSSQLQSNVPNSVICGGGPNGTSACNGDSGGPFAVNVNGDVYNIGTVSWGRSCQGATAFTRTSSYTDWIERKTGITAGPGGDEKPVARFSSMVAGNNVSFSNGSTDDRGIESYSWDFGDGSQGSSAYEPSHYYAQDGDYIVTLTVTDTKGQTGTTSNLVKIGSVDAGCDGLSAWNSATIYALNDVVSYHNRKYQAIWWSAGAQPDIFSNVWRDLGACTDR